MARPLKIMNPTFKVIGQDLQPLSDPGVTKPPSKLPVALSELPQIFDIVHGIAPTPIPQTGSVQIGSSFFSRVRADGFPANPTRSEPVKS
ncbi:MAG: hypothetical protein QOI12_4900 [Alphaproteobacteria bacterium]|nr:hypothetical protein [Alphaproteobacteria bacterium]